VPLAELWHERCPYAPAFRANACFFVQGHTSENGMNREPRRVPMVDFIDPDRSNLEHNIPEQHDHGLIP
jgi:hypothetical protein